MTDIGPTGFQEGQPIWVIEPDGSRRAAEYVGEAETSTWFGGPPRSYVVYLDTRKGDAVEAERLLPREV